MKTSLKSMVVAGSLSVTLLASGCGPYQIRYQMPSRQASEFVTTKAHAHGVGLIGGGAWFFFLHQMFPALVDYTGPEDVEKLAPKGFAEISHYHTFGQNAGAAFLSWLAFLNVYHESTVEVKHAL